MDNVHKSDKRAWIDLPLKLEYMLKEGREDTVTNLVYSHNNTEDALKAFLPDIQFNFKEIKEAVSFKTMINKLGHKVEIAKTFEIPDMKRLQTVEFQKKDVDYRNSNSSYAMMISNEMKNPLFPDNRPWTEQESQREISSDLIKLPELLLTVLIYHPTKGVGKYQVCRIMLNQEISVISQQFLSKLRDVISCPSDSVVPGDFSEAPTIPSSRHCKDLYNSGFFYIDGIFYNDFRSADSDNYSKDIMDWAIENQRGIGPFRSRSMEETRFIDLKIRLGYPYVYRHQGDCEHLLVFNDVRAMNKEDCLDRHSYPTMSRYIPKRRTVCMICQTQTASWVVTKNWYLPETTYFVCEPCLDGFFYDKDKMKVGEFELRKFVDRSSIV